MVTSQGNSAEGGSTRFTARTAGPEETRELARRLGTVCRGGETILLYGDLGAGKTCFTQGLALGLGIPPETRVTSPTFTLHGQYAGRLLLNHLDLYRLDEGGELDALGVADLIDEPGAVLAVEWPERLADLAAGDCLEVGLEHVGETERELRACASGERHRALLEKWRRAAES